MSKFEDNTSFIDFLSSDIGSHIFRENSLLIHIETGNTCKNKSVFKFLLSQQDETKQRIQTALSYSDIFSNYIRNIIDDIDHKTVDKYDFFTNKNVKYLFYRFNNFLLFRSQPIRTVRHSKKTVNEIVIEEVQSRDWQYLVESLNQLVETNNSHLKPLPKHEQRIIKSMKYNYQIARRVYQSTYENLAEQFEIYVNSLPHDKIDELERDFRGNGNGLLSIRDTESVTELFNSFAMFYYLNGTFPFTDGHRFVPDGDAPPGIIGDKLNLKELFAKFFMTGSRGLVSSPFIATILLFFAGNEKLAKDFLTELYYTLLVEILSKDDNELLKFDALTDLCTKVGVRICNAIFANNERVRLNMKKQTKEISKNMTFFIDDDDKKDVKIKFDNKKNSMKIEVDDDIETIPYLSSKNKTKKNDDAETILYASLYNFPKHEIDEKIYVEPKLETIEEIEEKNFKKRG